MPPTGATSVSTRSPIRCHEAQAPACATAKLASTLAAGMTRDEAMAQPRFLVVFDGRLVEGADPARVKANLAQVFKTEVAKVEPLFAGRRAVIKRGLDETTARKYQAVLARAGAVVELIEEGGQPPASTPPPAAEPAAPPARPRPASPPAAPGPGPEPQAGLKPDARPETGAPGAADRPGTASAPESATPASAPRDDAAREGPTRAELAEAGRAPPPRVARGTPSVPDDLSMAEPGALLVDGPRGNQTPDIDTSHLSLAEPGAELGEHQPRPAPEFDLSGLELAPPGTPMGGDDGPPRRQ